MGLSYVKVYYDLLEALETLSESERGRLITAMLQHARQDDVIPLTGGERYLWPMLRAQIDRDMDCYREISAKRSEAARSGGRPSSSGEKQLQAKGIQKNQLHANTSNCNQDKDHDKDKDEDHDVYEARAPKGAKQSAKRFTPPSVADVAEYCAQRKNGIDPQKFIDHYSAKGWKIGSTPMKDWRAAVRTWESRDAKATTQAPAQKPHYNPFLAELREGLP
jgi:hypothetical protein